MRIFSSYEKKPKKHSLVISIPKTLHSRIFAKNVRLKFRDFHTVKHSVYTYIIYKSQGFFAKKKKEKKIRESNFFSSKS